MIDIIEEEIKVIYKLVESKYFSSDLSFDSTDACLRVALFYPRAANVEAIK